MDPLTMAALGLALGAFALLYAWSVVSVISRSDRDRAARAASRPANLAAHGTHDQSRDARGRFTKGAR